MTPVHKWLNDKQSCQKADVCIKIVSSYHWQYSLFSDLSSDYVSQESGFGHDPKNPPLLWIIWINDPFLDFSKETCPKTGHKN